MKLLLGAGALWPLLLIAGLLAALVIGVEVSDGMTYGMLVSSVLSAPAIGAVLYRLLPSEWSETRRVALAGLLAVPLFAAEVCFALLLLVIGMYTLGFAPA